MSGILNPTTLLSPLLSGAPETFARAVAAGLSSDGVGTAFLGGYRAALAALVPALAQPVLPVLAATESGPLHPREIRTTLTDGLLTGSKRYATGVPGADRAVVLATSEHRARRQAQRGLAREKTSTDRARLRLVAVIVSLSAPGVTVRPMPPTPFVPDVPHAEIDFHDTPILSEIPGDGWANVVRPFRTAEDIYVLSALTGYLIGVGARSDWPVSRLAPLCSVLSSFSALSAMDFSAPGTHVALAGAIGQLRAAIASLNWEQVNPDEAARWRRDVALLSVAERAREARLAKAWSDLQGG